MSVARPFQFPRMRTKLRRLFVLALVLVGHATLASIVVGAALIVGGQIVHFDAAGIIAKDDELTTAGPYAHVRNPFYLGSFLTDLGFCWVARSPWVALIWLPLFYIGVIHPRVRVEEARLLQLHGDAFRHYAARVPRYLPSRRGYEGPRRGRFSWARLVRHGEPSRQLHHMAFPLVMFAKLRLVALQRAGTHWAAAFPALWHDRSGRTAALLGLLLVAAPWATRQVVRVERLVVRLLDKLHGGAGPDGAHGRPRHKPRLP